MNRPEARLDLLHSDILSRVVKFLPPWDVEDLSCVNKRLREASLPVLFRAVRFEFSKTGLNGLKRLSDSDIRQHVVSLTYVAPEIVKPEILDLGYSNSELLTHEVYVDWIFAHDFLSDECPSYMLVYDVLRDICEEQRDIVERDLDRTVLSSVFTKLPRLDTVNLWFCRTIEEEEWIGSILARGLTMEESREFHSNATRKAVQLANASRSTGSTIRLFSTELPT